MAPPSHPRICKDKGPDIQIRKINEIVFQIIPVSVSVSVCRRRCRCVSVSVSVYFSVLFHFSICSIFFIIYLKFYVASLVGWSCFRPSSLKCCFPPLGWRCFLLHFGEVMSSLLSPFWVVLPSSLLSMVLQSPSRLVGGAAFPPPPPFGGCCFVPSSSECS